MQVNTLGPLVSIIIPTFNREKTIFKTISSCLMQTYKNLEILIIDDGSNDNTKFKIDQIKDKRVKYFYKENGGVSSARNFGIEKASGIFISLLDSDDYYFPNKIELAIKEFNSDESIDILFSPMYFYRGGSKTLLKVNRPFENNEDLSNYIFLNDQSIATSSLIFKTHVLKKLKFKRRLTHREEQELILRAQKHGYNIAKIKIPTGIQTDFSSNSRLSQSKNLQPRLESLKILNESGLISNEITGYLYATNISKWSFYIKPLWTINKILKAYNNKMISTKDLFIVFMGAILPYKIRRYLSSIIFKLVGTKANKEFLSQINNFRI